MNDVCMLDKEMGRRRGDHSKILEAFVPFVLSKIKFMWKNGVFQACSDSYAISFKQVKIGYTAKSQH